MFPNWIVNRVCKFFLGRFIREVVDLDGLQVQLGLGTIQLNCIALNTDFLNQQLSATPVIVKEGIIGSISIKMPCKLKLAAFENCEINVDGLALLLVPRTRTEVETSTEECSASDVYSEQVKGATYLNGVKDWVKKMAARMVEGLLLGLHVTIKNLIITFEQGSQICGTNLGGESSCQSQSILTLPVSGHGEGDENASGLLRDNVILTKLTNFQGVTVDLYDAIGNVSVLLIHGKGDGSIPGRSGSMDIPKIKAEIHFDRMKLHLQPCTIQSLNSLLHSICKCGDKVFEPNLCSNNEQSIGVEHDESITSLHLSESVATDVMISPFSNMPSPDMEESTLVSDPMIISSWLNLDLGEISNMPSPAREESTLIPGEETMNSLTVWMI